MLQVRPLVLQVWNLTESGISQKPNQKSNEVAQAVETYGGGINGIQGFNHVTGAQALCLSSGFLFFYFILR